MSVCACAGVGAARRERHGHIVAGRLRRLLDAGIAGENDQVGERDLLAAARRWIELELDALQRP